MSETWKTLSEYALRATYADNRAWIFAIAISLLIGGLVYMHSPWHEERAVSKRSIRARHRKDKDLLENRLTMVVEDAVKHGDITRTSADYHYDILRNAGYKEVGPDPMSGRPWYMGPQQIANLPEHLATLKKAIYLRLINAGVAVHKKLKRSTPGKEADVIYL